MLTDNIIGEAFIINGDVPVSWRDYNLRLATMVDKDVEVISLSSTDIRQYWDARQQSFVDNFRQFAARLASNDFHAELSRVPLFGAFLRWAKSSLADRLSEKQKLQLKLKLGKSMAPTPRSEATIDWPDPGRMVRECYPISLSNQKAKDTLGWAPAYNFEDGAATTGEWLKFARMLDKR
jgi:hypothetical protein